MNRPVFQQTEQQKSDASFRNQRTGLASAEEIVTLILRRYGLDEDIADDAAESVELQTEKPATVPVVSTEPGVLQQQSFCWE